MAGLLSWLGFGGDGNSPPSLLTTGDVRRNALFAGLQNLGGALIAAGQPRVAYQPNLGLSALPGAFQQGYNQAMTSGLQSARLERDEREQERINQIIEGTDPVPGLTDRQRETLRLLPSSVRAQALATSLTRPQGRVGTEEEHRMAGVPMGTLYFDGNNRPHLLNTPSVAGATTAAQEANRYRVVPPGAEIVGPPGAGVPAAPSAAPAAAPPAGPAAPPRIVLGSQPGPQQPIGIRNNNWLAYSPGGQVATFPTPEAGVARSVRRIDDLYRSGATTPQQLVTIWAQGPNYNAETASPEIRQRLANYIRNVALAAGVPVDQPMNLADPNVMNRVVTAMAAVETGGLPQGAAPIIARGIQMGRAQAQVAAAPAASDAAPPASAAPTQVAQAQPQGTGQLRTIYRSSQPPPGSQERAFDQNYGRLMGERAASIHAAAETAQQRLDEIAQLRTALTALREAGGTTGAGTPAAQVVTRALQALGATPEMLQRLGLPSNAAPGEVITAIANRLAMTMVGPGGLPANNFSEADRNFLVQSMPNLANRPEANEFLASVMERAAQRAIEMENRWLEAHGQGKDYSTFLREWRAYVRDNPIISQQDRDTAARFLGRTEETRGGGQAQAAPAATASQSQGATAQPGGRAAPAASTPPATSPPTAAPSSYGRGQEAAAPPPPASQPRSQARTSIPPAAQLRMAPLTTIQEAVDRWDELNAEQQAAVRQRLGVATRPLGRSGTDERPR